MKTVLRGTVGVVRRQGGRRVAAMLALAVSLAAGGMGGGGAWAAGGIQVNNVAAGTAAFSHAGSVTTVRTGGQNTIINYQRLGVAAGETLRFVQPTAASRVLNRVQGNTPSVINGSILSNGQVYLVNPAGVMFGNGAVVNAAGFYAAAGHMSNADFLAGKNAFTGNTGTVRNDGMIQADQVHLVGLNVENFGQIVADGSSGVVTMTAGKDVYIGETTSPTGTPSVLVKISGDGGTHAGTGVNNGGQVKAGGSLQMGAGDVYAAGIYNSGMLKGRSISLNSGKNTNVNTGTVDARNANGAGGTIEMLGDKVGVFSGRVDASGSLGGGTIKIGGDFHGAAGTLASSETVIGPTAVVKADSLISGDGGKVAIWSDNVTQFYGDISAVGGSGGGNGGFVEVSGKNDLIFRGMVDVSAAQGSAGTILMDPKDLTINHGISGSGSDDGSVGTGAIAIDFGTGGAGNNFTISDGSINALTGNVELRATRDMFIAGAALITPAAGKTLVLRAGRDITINSGARITTSAGILISAGDQNETPGDDGNITFSGGTITSGGGDIIMRATDMTIAGLFAAGAGTVAFETNQAGHVIHLGAGGSGDLNLSAAELGTTILSAGKVRIGDDAFQTGNVTISSVDLHNSNTLLEINSGTGDVVLTDGAGPALAWGKNISINAANITAANATNAHAEIATNTGTQITLNTSAAIGTGGKEIQIGTFNGAAEAGFTGTVDVTSLGVVFLNGLGGLTTTVHAANGLDLSTLGTNAGGNIVVTIPGATIPPTSFTTDAGTAQTVTINGTGALQVANITAAAGDALVVHAGTGGTGNLSFAAATTLSADNLTLQAGKGDGSTTASVVDFTNAPTIVDAAGTGTPGNFTIRQDADIADASLAAAQFTNGLPTNYGLQSDGGAVTVTGAGAANVAGTNLTLSGKNGVAITTNLTAGNALTGLTTVGATTLTGNVDASAGNVTINGALTIKQDTTLSGVGLQVTGDVASESGKVWTLTTTFSGTAEFDGNVGTTGGGELGALVVGGGGAAQFGNGAAVAVNTKVDTGTNATADGHIAINENLTLASDTTITVGFTGTPTAGQGDVTFGGTVNSAASANKSLVVSAPGVTWFQKNVGSGVNGALGGGTITAAGAGALELTKLGNGGTVGLTAGGALLFGDPVLLTADATVTSTAVAGNVTFNSTVDSEASKVWSLTVNAAGTTAFKDNVGLGTNGELGSLTTDLAGSTVLGNGGSFRILTKEDVGTDANAKGQVTLNDAITLAAAVRIDATNTTLVGGVDDVKLGQISGGDAFGITVNSPGVTWFAGGVNSSAGQGLTTITTDAGGSTKFGTGSGAISVVTTGAQVYGDKVVLGADTAFKGSSLEFDGAPVAIDANTQDLTLQSDTMTFLGGADSVQGGGNLRIKAFADSDNVVVGDTGVAANTLYLSPTDLLTFKDGFTTITIGSATMTGAMTITGDPITSDPVVFTDPVTFLATGAGATITLNSGLPTSKPVIYGDGNASVTVQGTSIILNGSIATNGNDITVNGATVLGTPSEIIMNAVDPVFNSLGSSGVAVGGKITMIGTVDDDGSPTLLQLFTVGGVTSGDVDLQAALGQSVPLDAFLVNGNILTVHSDIRTTGAGPDGGTVFLSTNGVLIAGDLNSTVTIDTDPTGGTSAAGAVIVGTIDYKPLTNGVTLVIDTSADGGGAGANITLTNVGLTTRLNALTLHAGTGDVSVTNVLVGGAFSSSGAAFTLNALGQLSAPFGVTINHTGAVKLDSEIQSGGPVSVTGVGITTGVAGEILGLNVTLAAGTGALNLSYVVIATDVLQITGAGLTTNLGAWLGGAFGVNLDCGTGNVILNDQVTAGGVFTSTGAIFTNNGLINAHGISITQTGAVNINNDLASAGFDVSVTGVGITQLAGAPITGLGITLAGGTNGVTLNDAVTGTGAVSITGTGVTANVGATIGGVAITVGSGTGDVLLDDTVTGTGLFTSTGGMFTNNGVINAHGVSITHTGAVNVNNDLASAGFNVGVTGVGITTLAGAPITGLGITLHAGTGALAINDAVTGTGALQLTGTGVSTTGAGSTLGGTAITLGGGTGNVALNATVTGTGLFTSTGAAFTNNAVVNAQGVSMTHTGLVSLNDAINSAGFVVGITGVGITQAAGATISGTAITLAGGTGAATLNAALTGTGAVGITGTGVTANVGATIGGVAITLGGGTGNVSVGDTVTGTGLFTSTGAIFTNNGVINAHGVLITQTGAVNIDNDLASAGFNVNVTGVGITQLAGAPITGLGITLAGGTGAVTLNDAVTGTGAVSITGTGVTANVGATIGGVAITLGGGTGNVSVGDTVTGTGLFTSTGVLFTNNGVVNAHGVTITHTGAVNVDNDLASAGFVVNVSGAGITTAAGAPITGTAITLNAGGGALSINDAVTGTGALALTGNGIATVGAGATLGGTAITLTGGAVSLGGAVTGTGLFTSTGTTFTNNAAIGAHGVTITHAGAVNLDGALNSAGFAVHVTGAGIAANGAGAISGAAVTLAGGAGNVTLGAAVTGTGLLTASGVNWTNSGAVSAVGVTLNMTGSETVNAALAGGAGDVNVAGTTFANGAAVSGANIKLTQSGLATLGAALNAGSGLITISSAGVTQTAGAIHGGSLVLKGTGTFSMPAANTVGTLAADVTGALTLQDASALTIGTAGSPGVTGITTHNGAFTLTMPTAALTIGAPINTGAGAILIDPTAITDAGSAITGGAISMTAAGAISFDTPVSGSGAVTFIGQGVSMNTVIGASVSLTSTTGALSTRSITATTGGIALTAPTSQISGTFTAAGGFSAGTTVLVNTTVIAAGGTDGITLGNVTGTAALEATASNAAGKVAVGSIGTSTADRMGNVTLNGALIELLGDIYSSGQVAFGDNIVSGTRADVPTAATVFSNGSRTVDAAGGFSMEQNQKFTVHDTVNGIGDLTIRTNGSEITLGDLSALGKIMLDTGDVNTHITFLNRTPQRELLPSGSLDSQADNGTDIVAGFNGVGAITIKGTVVVVGGTAQHRIEFASVAASTDITGKPGELGFLAGSNLFVVPVNISSSSLIHEADLTSGATVLDLVARGISGTSPSATQGAVIPRDVQTLSPERGQAISGALRDALRELGIYARDLRTDEIIEYLIGRALYDDVPYKLDPGPTDNTVAANRLPYSPVLPTVDAYRKLFFKQEVGDDGKPVVENGKPKMTSQDSVILRSFGETWQSYTKDKGDDATPKGFREYLEGHEKDDAKMATALDYLNQLRDLLVQIKSLGLTPTEFDVSRKVLVSKVRPPNIKEEDFMDVVNGPTSRSAGVALK